MLCSKAAQALALRWMLNMEVMFSSLAVFWHIAHINLFMSYREGFQLIFGFQFSLAEVPKMFSIKPFVFQIWLRSINKISWLVGEFFFYALFEN